MDEEVEFIIQSAEQACLYCRQRLGPAVIPVQVPSRTHGSSQFWLHSECFRAAFAAAAVPFSEDALADMTVEWPSPDG